MSELPFNVGDQVCVREGVTDPDFPGVLLEGWQGTVSDIDPTAEPPLFLVAWNEATLEAMSVGMVRRCHRDGLEWQRAWMKADDLDRNQSAIRTVPEQKPIPLDLNNPEERARNALGLTSEDDLPLVEPESLSTYHDYLTRQLKFPFPATIELNDANFSPGMRLVMVLRLLPADQAKYPVGLLAEVAVGESRMEVPLAALMPVAGDAAESDLTAYTLWVGEGMGPPPGRLSRHPFLLLGLAVVLAGGVAGTAIATVPGGMLGALFGAVAVGAIGFLLGIRMEMMARLVNQMPAGFLGGALLGFAGGSALGAVLGAMVMGYFGSIPGAIAGTVANWLLTQAGVRWPRGWLIAIGAGVGTVTAALLLDFWVGLAGLGYGFLVGGVVALLLIGGGMGYLAVVFRYYEVR